MEDRDHDKLNEEDRRRCSRKDIATDVTYRVVTPSGGGGVTKNICEGGLCIFLEKEIPVGTILELKFELPREDAPIETFAKVIWQRKIDRGFLTGVKFGT